MLTERFVVIGGGTMGVGIAYVAATAGYRVDLVEVDPARAAGIRDTLDQHWRRAVGRGKVTDAVARASTARVAISGDLNTVTPKPDVVVEAVPEQIELKKTVLGAAELLEPALLGSNTSSISIAALAEDLADPHRLVGLHFFNPVWAMPLLEVVVGPATTEQTSLRPSRSRTGSERTRSWSATHPASPPPDWVWRWAWRRCGCLPTVWPARRTSTRQ